MVAYPDNAQNPQITGASNMISANQVCVSTSKFTSDSDHLRAVQNELFTALGTLGQAKTLLEQTGLSEQYTAVYAALQSAVQATFTGIQDCESSLPSESPTHF